mmetsp:Transcript_24550/g.48163  ORF Transcript_24550/g.48163 Transcript_24550/m.48163 type:complete len:87 (-) Transcript_24550:1524-1784(-)
MESRTKPPNRGDKRRTRRRKKKEETGKRFRTYGWVRVTRVGESESNNLGEGKKRKERRMEKVFLTTGRRKEYKEAAEGRMMMHDHS